MTRISLKEAYDNRDVIAQLVRLRDDVDELLAILKDINPSGDLTNIVTKTGNQTIDGEKTFIGKIIADCDIIQNGAAYETHAEQIYSHNDYMVMRDGQLNGLAPGTYSGLQIKKYNGSDDARMVVDNTGIMRVGDVNDEKPLAVRDEAADMSSGALVRWNGVDEKIETVEAVGDCLVSLSQNHVMAGSGAEKIPFDTINNTTDYSISNGSVTIKKPGNYLVLVSTRFTLADQSTPLYSNARLTLNGADIAAWDGKHTTAGTIKIQRKITATANSVLALYEHWGYATPSLTINGYAPGTYIQIIRLPW